MGILKQFALGLALLVAVDVAAADPHASDTVLIASLRTINGTRLTGQLDVDPRETVDVAGAKLLLWERIAAVDRTEGDEAAKITLRGGDVVRGRIASKRVLLVTVPGRVSVPWSQIVEMKIDAPGHLPDALAHSPAPRGPVRFEISLRDGSSILATPDRPSARFAAEFGNVEVPWARVRRVSFGEDSKSCSLTFWNGDVLVGTSDWSSCTLSTGLGSVTISPEKTSSVAVSLGGIDLVARPYETATGNRHFLSSMKSTAPRRVGGRIYPASQLIEAHASGQIEYRFERPVREFHAVIGMYESYPARKGNVIFKLQTEDGLVYASRSIRNAQQEEVYVRFRPTKKLILITDQNGPADEDWSVWLRPEVR